MFLGKASNESEENTISIFKVFAVFIIIILAYASPAFLDYITCFVIKLSWKEKMGTPSVHAVDF